MAQLDVHPTEDRVVVDSTPARSAIFFRAD